MAISLFNLFRSTVATKMTPPPQGASFEQARVYSKGIAASVGVKIIEDLPLLHSIRLRSLDEVVDRALCANVIQYVDSGWKRESAIKALTREGLLKALTPAELIFLETGGGDLAKAKSRRWSDTGTWRAQVDALWVLAWALGIVEKLEFWVGVQDYLASRFPAVTRGEACAAFRESVGLRSEDEILKALDLHHCLHWAIRQADLHGRDIAPSLRGMRIVERRRALEWLAAGSDWDHPNLDA